MNSSFFHLAIAWLLPLSASRCKFDLDGWRQLSYEELLFQSDLVVVGTDVQHVKNDQDAMIGDIEFKVSCVLKGDNRGISENIKIIGLFPGNSCSKSVMQRGNDYIVGLQRSGAEYVLHEVNIAQPVSFPNTTENLSRALSVCGLQNPSLPAGTYHSQGYTFCHNGNPGGVCSSGIQRHSHNTGLLLSIVVISVTNVYVF